MYVPTYPVKSPMFGRNRFDEIDKNFVSEENVETGNGIKFEEKIDTQIICGFVKELH
jgi:hypothetical protein